MDFKSVAQWIAENIDTVTGIFIAIIVSIQAVFGKINKSKFDKNMESVANYYNSIGQIVYESTEELKDKYAKIAEMYTGEVQARKRVENQTQQLMELMVNLLTVANVPLSVKQEFIKGLHEIDKDFVKPETVAILADVVAEEEKRIEQEDDILGEELEKLERIV